MNKRNLYTQIDANIAKKITKLVDCGFEQAALGTVGANKFPFVSKTIPMLFQNDIYVLLSDLSEHTRNVDCNPSVSIYFAAAESHQTKSNNPRLTLQGYLLKLSLKKEDEQFEALLSKYAKLDKGAELWAKFSDFNFYKFRVKRRLYIGGFGKAYEDFND